MSEAKNIVSLEDFVAATLKRVLTEAIPGYDPDDTLAEVRVTVYDPSEGEEPDEPVHFYLASKESFQR